MTTILERIKGQQVRGECVLVVGGCESVLEDMSDWLTNDDKKEKVHSYINDALNSGVKLSRACAEAAKEFGISRSDIYRDALASQQN